MTPAPRPRRRPDAPRRAAYDTLRAVAASDSYANLVLPPMLDDRRIVGRDAAFATELAYGTLRLRGRYDAVIALTSSRPLRHLDPPVLDVLRLGAHQLLGMRVPAHAAVSATVDLANTVLGAGPVRMVNAVLRAISAVEPEIWLQRIEEEAPDRLEALATVHSHPRWIVRALRDALALDPGSPSGSEALDAELVALLEADNAAPAVSLVARPGLVEVDELRREADGDLGRLSPLAVTLPGGAPALLASVRSGRAGVQDEGSQLAALALAGAPLVSGSDESWADMCAGPGGKAALLAATLAERSSGAGLLRAGEPSEHRAELVRRALHALPAGSWSVHVEDGRDLGSDRPGSFDRVLVDAPCTGLGALRRRPESRWRRSLTDLAELGVLQRSLLSSAIDAARPGGIVAYVTCSPHLAETRFVVEDAVRRHPGTHVLNAADVVRDEALAPPDGLGDGPWAQLWPHRHGTDAMFISLLRVSDDGRA